MKCLGERERKGHSEAAREVERHQTMSRHSVKGTGLHFRRGQRDQEKQRGDFVCMSLQAGVLFSRKDLACHYKQMCCFQGRTSR